MKPEYEWLKDLKPMVLGLLSQLRGRENKGYFKYSLTGDLFEEKRHWGLGNSVFAAKILYMFDEVTEEDRETISTFIRSFQDVNGEIYDPTVQKFSRLGRWAGSLSHLDFNNFLNAQTRRAETRQAVAALRCLGRKPDMLFQGIPSSKEKIGQYINSLDWTRPWGAASHISHLLFFLHNNSRHFNKCNNDIDDFVDFVLKTTNNYQQNDGAWYLSGANVPISQKINGSMKMITAYDAAGRTNFSKPEELIDLCLSAVNDEQACDNFNIVYVLHQCFLKTGHRADEVRKFGAGRLGIYKEYYWPEYGGFSFKKGAANDIYYGAKVSKGLPEPDIHGTVLFLWGIAMLSKICGLENMIQLKMPVT